MQKFSGKLYIVAMPIGNSDDITRRALQILDKVDGILCEDSRKTGYLLKQWDIQNRLTTLNAHNQKNRSEEIIRWLQQGQSYALVSDAGTPAVSDPGTLLIYQAHKKGIDVIPVPGVSAPVAAYMVSGFAPKTAIFLGFLSPKKGKRKKILAKYGLSDTIVIVFESPHRIVNLLQDMLDVWGDQAIFIGREMTKIHETFYRGNISEMLQYWQQNKALGEFTLVTEVKKPD